MENKNTKDLNFEEQAVKEKYRVFKALNRLVLIVLGLIIVPIPFPAGMVVLLAATVVLLIVLGVFAIIGALEYDKNSYVFNTSFRRTSAEYWRYTLKSIMNFDWDIKFKIK